MINPIVNELLQQVHTYYPIGGDKVEKTFPGKIKYDALLENKIALAVNKQPTAWEDFVSELNNLNEYFLFNMGYLQFPAYIGRIAMLSDENAKFTMQRQLVIVVSLLCDYYTLYFEDTYIFAGYLGLPIKPRLYILFSKRVDLEKEMVLFNTVNHMLKNKFPRFGFVNHRILFGNELKGGFVYADGEAYPEQQMSLFNFLFDGDFLYKEQHPAIYD